MCERDNGVLHIRTETRTYTENTPTAKERENIEERRLSVSEESTKSKEEEKKKEKKKYVGEQSPIFSV